MEVKTSDIHFKAAAELRASGISNQIFRRVVAGVKTFTVVMADRTASFCSYDEAVGYLRRCADRAGHLGKQDL